MKTFFFRFFSFFLVFFIFSLGVSANTFIQKKVQGKSVKIIQYALNSQEYDIKIGYTSDATDMRDIMEQFNGVTAINGVFFCPADYSECKGKTFTINEHYVEGKKIGTYESTGDRVVFGWDKDKVPLLFQTDKINAQREGEIYEGFANHPLLLKDGKNMLEYWYDSYLIDKKMLAPATRNFICSDTTKEHIYFGIVYDVSLDDEIPILQEIGCSDALNLDAGKSTAFIYNGRYLLGPQRPILDGVIIERKGLNTRKVREKGERILEGIIKKIEKKKDKKQILEGLQKKLNNARIKIYDKYSFDTFDKEGKVNGYKIEVSDIKVIEKLYLINYLNSLLYKKIVSL